MVRPSWIFVLHHRGGQRPGVGIDRHQIRVAHAVEQETIEHVVAGAPEADDFDADVLLQEADIPGGFGSWRI